MDLFAYLKTLQPVTPAQARELATRRAARAMARNLHPEPMPEPARSLTFEQVRAMEANRVREPVTALGDGGVPFLAGDFDSWKTGGVR